MTNPSLKKISTINDEIDIKLFLYIAKKNILFPIIFILIAVAGAWIYLRYTPPVFQTSAIIQMEGQFQATRILPTAGIYEEDIARQLELMRSDVFLQRALSRLPLDVSYFSKGRVLNHELYRNSPFTVDIIVKDPSIYGIPVYLDFVSQENIIISFTHRGQSKKYEIHVNGPNSLPEMDIIINVHNFNMIREEQSLFSRNHFFFVLNNPETLASVYSRDIKINVLNPAAKTIQINYQGTNAAKASDIVNIIAEEFGMYDLEKKTESANNILAFIDQQLSLLGSTLTTAEIELENFRKEHGIDDVTITPLPMLQTRIADFENQIVMLQLEKSIFSEIEKSLQFEDEADIFRLIAILSGSEFRGNISGMLRTLQDQLLDRERLLYEVTAESRQIEALNYQIEIQKRILAESISTLKANLQNRINELRGKIVDYESYFLNQTGQYSLVEYSMLQRVYSINERFYNQLVEKKAEYSISKAGYVSESVILERSRTPGRPISPIPRMVYVSSLLAAIVLGLGVFLLKYLFYNEIPSLHDLLKYTHAPVIGVLPRYKSDIPPNQLLVLKKPKSLIAEALRAIRTNLQFIDNTPGSKLVAVTSTISGEGKTFFAMNLAGILAFSDKKVVVIDLDMRMPKIHKGFNVENVKGVSTILSKIDEIEDCIQPSKVKNLDFITAGPPPPNPSELILKAEMDELIQYLKSKYDYVIVDNPPVGIVTDGMKSILMADYPVYILKANYSKRMFIQNINRLMTENKVSRLSVVLNAVDREYSSYGYEKGYSYGYFYGKHGEELGYYDDPHSTERKSFWWRLIKFRK
ncbi:MAG: polysaccharide biosynthesis tyrosine autokinase [Bacteroidetes bacterium]|nr:MAG: polysaccharide biosynthesis tyrosine autokinase [Bacteroidota bacterium]